MSMIKIRLIVMSIVGTLCLIMALVTMNTKVNAMREHKKIVNQWNMQLANLKVVPTPENIFLMQKEYKWLVNTEEELKQLLSKRKIQYTELTPLQFKEELLDTQVKLKQLADIQGCKLQGDLGFSEFSAGGIPEAKDVILLTKQLKVINELVNLLLKNRVAEISSITRFPEVYYNEANLYQEVTFRVVICCTLEGLLKVLVDITNVPYVLVVRNLKIDKLDENKVNVEMLIGEVEFT